MMQFIDRLCLKTALLEELMGIKLSNLPGPLNLLSLRSESGSLSYPRVYPFSQGSFCNIGGRAATGYALN